MNQVKGSDLSQKDQTHVLNAYVHRFTKSHVPDWARKPMPNGEACPVQFDSDLSWLENTLFNVTKSGKLDNRFRYCQSSPVWPDNPELR